jgi:hypothetical protein
LLPSTISNSVFETYSFVFHSHKPFSIPKTPNVNVIFNFAENQQNLLKDYYVIFIYLFPFSIFPVNSHIQINQISVEILFQVILITWNNDSELNYFFIHLNTK